MSDNQGDTLPADQPDVTVTRSPVPGQIGVTFRQELLALGGWALGRHWIKDDTEQMLLIVVPFAATVAWGQLKQWWDHRDKKALAISAPIGKLK